MYLSFKKIFDKHNLTPNQILLLQAIHQQKNQDNENYISLLYDDDFIEDFSARGLIKYNKQKKNQSEISLLRTTPKGRKFLLDLQKDEEYDEAIDLKLANWIETIYKKRPNYIKSNITEMARRLHWFRFEKGMEPNEVAVLIENFLNDTYIDDPDDKRNFNDKFREFKNDNPRAQNSNKAENVIFSPNNRYQKYYSLEKSPLNDYYEQFTDFIKKKWAERLKK